MEQYYFLDGQRFKVEDISAADWFTLRGIVCDAICTKVYDGDTVHLVINLFGGLYKFSCRMLGYNSAEIRGASDYEREKGREARDYLKELILWKNVRAKFGDFDKYGRPLVEVFLGGKSVNKIMVDSGNGAEYYGRGEKKFE